MPSWPSLFSKNKKRKRKKIFVCFHIVFSPSSIRLLQDSKGQFLAGKFPSNTVIIFVPFSGKHFIDVDVFNFTQNERRESIRTNGEWIASSKDFSERKRDLIRSCTVGSCSLFLATHHRQSGHHTSQYNPLYMPQCFGR